MRPICILFAVVLLVVYSTASGQELQPRPIKRISIQDIFVQTGIISANEINGSLQDFRMLAPQSVLLNDDFNGYFQSTGPELTGNPLFSIQLGIHFSDRQKNSYKPNPLLRLGITYFSGTNLTGNIHKEERKPYDTITSGQTGQIYYIDSVTRYNYWMDYSSEQLNLDGSLIFRTNPNARWSLFAGIGITAGFSFSSRTSINYGRSNTVESHDYNNHSYSSSYYIGLSDVKIEDFRNKTNVAFSTYVPLGLDFRMGKKNEFFKRIHLFFEMKPGINITSIPELRTYTHAFIHAGIGLRVTWG